MDMLDKQLLSWVKNGNLTKVRAAVEKHPEYLRKEVEEMTLLGWACASGDVEMALMLLPISDATWKSMKMGSCLTLALKGFANKREGSKGNQDKIKGLIKQLVESIESLSINCFSECERISAIKYGFDEECLFLVDKFGFAKEEGHDGLLDMAVKHDRLNLFEALLSRADEKMINAVNSDSKSLLIELMTRSPMEEHDENVSERRVEAVKRFIERVPDLRDVADRNGVTPLMVAVENQYPIDVIKKLITENTAKSHDGNGWSPLHWAAFGGCDEEIVKVLVEICDLSERGVIAESAYDVAKNTGNGEKANLYTLEYWVKWEKEQLGMATEKPSETRKKARI